MGLRTIPKVSAMNSATKEDSNMDFGALAPPPRTKPIAFVPLSDHTWEEQQRLSRTLLVLYPGHGNPTMEDMREGLTSFSREFATPTRSFTMVGTNV